MELAVDLPQPEMLAQQHKKEKKDLQAKIQALKKTATKGDKKKKKEVQDEISKLENDLIARHAAEVASLGTVDVQIDEVSDQVDILALETANKTTKAQKRRSKKELSNQERAQRIADQDIENLTGSRHVESEKIKNKLKQKGLMIYEIASDGDCLYAAVDHGNDRISGQLFGVANLRKMVSSYIKANKDDFAPFLIHPDTGEMLSDQQFDDYCGMIKTTQQWGGHVELGALAHIVKKALVVVQAEGADLIMGEEYRQEGEIILSYHRHMYKLGEHYNSVQPYEEPQEL